MEAGRRRDGGGTEAGRRQDGPADPDLESNKNSSAMHLLLVVLLARLSAFGQVQRKRMVRGTRPSRGEDLRLVFFVAVFFPCIGLPIYLLGLVPSGRDGWRERERGNSSSLQVGGSMVQPRGQAHFHRQDTCMTTRARPECLAAARGFQLPLLRQFSPDNQGCFFMLVTGSMTMECREEEEEEEEDGDRG